MPTYLTFFETDLTPRDATSRAELQALAAEAMGWLPLGQGAFLHLGDADGRENVIEVVGVPDAQMAGLNVLLLA